MFVDPYNPLGSSIKGSWLRVSARCPTPCVSALQTQQETPLTTQEAELPQRLEFKLQELEGATASVQTADSLARMAILYKDDARDNKRCYTCERPFDSDAAVADFIAKQVSNARDLHCELVQCLCAEP